MSHYIVGLRLGLEIDFICEEETGKPVVYEGEDDAIDALLMLAKYNVNAPSDAELVVVQVKP